MSKVIGIDLGTTNSVCAVVEGGEPIIIPNAEGARLTPSIVGINPKNGERLVGQMAKRQAVINPESTIFSIKRFMGRKYRDLEIQRAIQTVSYKVAEAENGDVRVLLGDKAYSPPEVSAFILQKIKADAESFLGEEVTQAVITVPAYFDDAQRQATKDAGRIAGLEVLRIINEPTASALAYGLEKSNSGMIAVFDLGGGTFDISILDVGEGVFEVCATNGDTFLGGDDWDNRVMEWIIKEFNKQTDVDVRNDRQALQRIRETAEKAKIELSSLMETEINLPFIMSDSRGPHHLQMELTRAQLEQLTLDLIERTLTPCQRAMQDARLTPEAIDAVVLVGGMTRMPLIRKRVAEFFGKEPHRGVNPDEVVALGAAIQGGVLNGEVNDILLLDVTPLTLGIVTLGGVSTPLIARNTTVPTRRSQIFSTATDNQTQVEVHVVQGERPNAADNKSLGRFVLDGIPPAPRGTPKIEVAFDIDADGILNVTAIDQTTGHEQTMQVIPSSGLNEIEINRMVREAEQYRERDRHYQELIKARNHADNALYMAAAFLKRAAPQISETARQSIALVVEALQAAKEHGDMDKMREHSLLLTQTVEEIGHMFLGEAPTTPSGPALDDRRRQ